MKQFCFFILILALCTPLFAKKMQRPAFIVDGEPIPPGLTLSYEQPFTQHKSYRSFLFDATPLVITRGDAFQFYGMLGAMSEQYGDSLADKGIPSDYLGVYAATNVSGTFGKGLIFQSYHSVGSFATEADIFKRDALRYFQVSTLGIKWKPNFQTSIGILVSTRFGEPLIIPLGKVVVSQKKFVAELTVPVTASFRYVMNEKLHLVTFYKSSSTGYTIDSPAGDALQRSCSNIGVYGEHRIYKWFWGRAGVMFSTRTELTNLLSDYEVVQNESAASWKAMIALFIRPD